MRHSRITAALLAPALLLSACLFQTKVREGYCEAAADCPAGQTCDPNTLQCVASNTRDMAVGPAPDLTMPDLAPQCRVTSDCKDDAAPVCDGVSGTCRTCRGQMDDAQCQTRSAATPRCEAILGKCVECAAVGDCKAATKPICEVGACRACKFNLECPLDICNADGSCAGAADIVYVDNKGGACVGVGHAGTAMDPHCQIGEALTNLGGKKIVKVAGSAVAYGAVAVASAVDVRIVGPGVAAMPPATIFEAGKTSVALVPSAGATAIAFEGLVIKGDGNNVLDGLSCTPMNLATVSLKVKECLLTNAKGAGLRSTSCDVILSQSTVSSNSGGGLNLYTSTYAILNNFIIANPGRGISIDDASMGVFAFNTVVGNGVPNTAGAVTCGTADKLIENSVIWGNSIVNGSQFAGTNCKLKGVVVGMDATAETGAIKVDPEIVNSMPPMGMPIDAHLKKASAANKACCVDKVTPGDAGAMSLPALDFDGTKRPLGAGWDIGAHEVE